MKLYLLIVIAMASLLNGVEKVVVDSNNSVNTNTYSDNYSVLPKTKDSQNYDVLMHGEFEEIIRYKEISFKYGNLNDNQKRVKDIAKKILSYDQNRTLISIIGHTNSDENNITKQIQDSYTYANDIANKLTDHNISKQTMIIEARGSEDNLYTKGTEEGKKLLHQVMVSIYIKKKIAEIEKDSDNDGVLDSKDSCPSTLRGLVVNEQGCHIFKTLNLYYITSSAIIKEESMWKVVEFTEFLTKNSIYKVEIIGHTDDRASEASNQILSEQRANSVKEYLLANGIDKSRISTKGMGESEPLVSNDTEINRAKNRRIEVKLDFVVKQKLNSK